MNGSIATPVSRPVPQPLAMLVELSLDLRWTWSHSTDHIWKTLDPLAWERTGNPWLILQSVPQRRLEQLAADGTYTAELARLVAARREYLDSPSWCARHVPAARGLTVAYFSMEYGLSEALPIYSGGLGVLAGDHLKTASDLGLPLVGVGLLYQQGYFRQVLDADGTQLELQPQNASIDLPVAPVMASDGSRLVVQVELPGRHLRLRAWHARVGRVPLYMLDSNDPLNTPADRGITAQLYTGGAEHRLQQEIVLGIGGWQLLQALGIEPGVCHLNEGHAAFVTLERARTHMTRRQCSFEEALWATRPGNIFTTHTPVAAAFDTYSSSMMRRYGARYVETLGVEPRQLLALGRLRDDDDEPFNMAYLAARTCGYVNGVSRLHGAVSRRIFQPLFPRWPESEVPVSHITNGVHMPSWDSAAADRLWTRACGAARWREPLVDVAGALATVSDAELWAMRTEQRAELVDYARHRVARQVAERGGAADAVRLAAAALDPAALTLGFARRFTAYKRPHLLLQDLERLARLLKDVNRPVQLVIAGKAHPADGRGKELIRQWVAFVSRPDVCHRAVFVEDYDLALGAMLVKGIDCWINTPLRPWEASGTSGMKVLVNGGLNLSSLDGWWAEAYTPEVGWSIGKVTGEAVVDPETAPGRHESEELYERLERQIVPAFYDRDADGPPRHWLSMVRSSMASLTPEFSSARTVRQYLDEAYLPADAARRRRDASATGGARELASWATRLRMSWSTIAIGRLMSFGEAGSRSFQVPVHLGEVDPADVAVELFADAREGEPTVRIEMQCGAPVTGDANGFVYDCQLCTTRLPTHFTPRVVPRSRTARVPLELPLIHWGEPG